MIRDALVERVAEVITDHLLALLADDSTREEIANAARSAASAVIAALPELAHAGMHESSDGDTAWNGPEREASA